jgi:hypothetical protein
MHGFSINGNSEISPLLGIDAPFPLGYFYNIKISTFDGSKLSEERIHDAIVPNDHKWIFRNN